MPWFGSSPFGGGREGIRPKRQDGGGSSGRGMQNPIHFQPPMLAVPRSTVVTDESGKEVALHTVKVRGVGIEWGRRP